MIGKKQLVSVLFVPFGLWMAAGCVVRHPPHPAPITAMPAPKESDQPAKVSPETVSPTTVPASIRVDPSTPAEMDADTAARLKVLLAKIQDAYFDYDRHDLRPDAVAALEEDVAVLRSILLDFPAVNLTIEGHCDERGSAEYNLGLGDLRAQRAKEFLIERRIPARQLEVISFGKERPQCTQSNEACWQKNRRAHLTKNQ